MTWNCSHSTYIDLYRGFQKEPTFLHPGPRSPTKKNQKIPLMQAAMTENCCFNQDRKIKILSSFGSSDPLATFLKQNYPAFCFSLIWLFSSFHCPLGITVRDFSLERHLCSLSWSSCSIAAHWHPPHLNSSYSGATHTGGQNALKNQHDMSKQNQIQAHFGNTKIKIHLSHCFDVEKHIFSNGFSIYVS